MDQLFRPRTLGGEETLAEQSFKNNIIMVQKNLNYSSIIKNNIFMGINNNIFYGNLK